MDENNNPLDSGLSAMGPAETLQVTPNIKNYWQEIANWALFFAILGFISLGFMVISTFYSERETSFEENLFGLLISGAIVIVPYWFLFQFAQQLRKGLQAESTEATEAGFGYLRRFYQFIGVLSIIFLSLYVVALLSVFSMQATM